MDKKLTGMFFGLMVILFSVSSAAEPSETALQDLYKPAKAEGKVIWQYMGSLNDVKGVAAAFQAKYPEIKLEVFSFSSARTPTRIIGEATAKKLTLDVASIRPYNLIPLVERDLLVKFDWTKFGVPQNAVLLDGACAVLFENPYVWLRNTNLVSEAAQPKTWEDVLDPKWKGHKISLRAAAGPFTSLFLTWKKDKQRATDYVTRIKQQEVVPGDRATLVTNRIATGECPIGRIGIVYVLDALKEKAPIAICPISPTADFGSTICIPKGVPNPNAAKFFAAWLFSQEAAKEWLKVGFGLAYPPEASLIARTLTKNGIKYERITSKEDILEFEGGFSSMVMKTMGFQPGAE